MQTTVGIWVCLVAVALVIYPLHRRHTHDIGVMGYYKLIMCANFRGFQTKIHTQLWYPKQLIASVSISINKTILYNYELTGGLSHWHCRDRKEGNLQRSLRASTTDPVSNHSTVSLLFISKWHFTAAKIIQYSVFSSHINQVLLAILAWGRHWNIKRKNNLTEKMT